MNEYWNQESELSDSIYQAPMRKMRAREIRAAARAALKPCYWHALVACLLAMLLGAIYISVNVDIPWSHLYEGDLSAKLVEVYGIFRMSGLGAVFERYPKVLAAALAFGVCTLGGILFALLISAPAKVGYQRYHLGVIDGDGKKIGLVFSSFGQGYGKSMGVSILYTLIHVLCFLPVALSLSFLAGTLLMMQAITIQETVDGLQALGYIFALGNEILWFLFGLAALVLSLILYLILRYTVLYRFYFCYMILAEYPEMRVIDALRNSANLMRGNKWRLFCLEFSFIGWNILASLLWGVGHFFLMPYKQAAYASFYNEIANRQAAHDVEFPSLNPDDYVTD